MNAHIAKFSICSLGLHFVVLFYFWHIRPFEQGGVPHANDVPVTVSARLIAKRAASKPPHSAEKEDKEDRTTAKQPSNLPSEVKNSEPPAEQEFLPSNDFLSAGKLTLKPGPITPIDLNIAEISGIAFSGSVELAILIDVDGTVVDVIPSTDADNAEEFIERVVERFRGARFSPGEINGRPVRSQVRVTVVSEELPSSAH
jgi:hypothetical protein